MRRTIVGAHYGWRDFLAQRITAVVMVVYTLLVLAIALYSGGLDYAGWRALFGYTSFKVATLLFAFALLWHAWIGMRDILMDYIQPVSWRLGLEVVVILLLTAWALWAVQILWSV